MRLKQKIDVESLELNMTGMEATYEQAVQSVFDEGLWD